MTTPPAACALPILFLAVALSACGDGGSASPPASPATSAKWVATWADAPSELSTEAGSEQTFRAIVKPTVGGRGTVRLHFSNYFGSAPVTLGAVHVGVQTAKAGVMRDTVVTFSGAGAVTIPAGAGGFVTSDPVALAFAYGDVLAVTEYVRGSWSGLTRHLQSGGNVTSYATPVNAGNQTGDQTGASFTQTTQSVALLDRVEAYGNYKGTVAAFGSSTTDGVHSGLDQHMTYPEQLAAALHSAGRDDVAIANVGIAGTQMLGSGPTAGVNRFARDVLGLPGVTTVIDYLGGNDLRLSCVKAETLIAGKQNLASQAHAAGLKLYLATTTPSDFCEQNDGKQSPNGFGTRYPEGSGEDAQRLLVNAWDLSSQSSSVNGTLEQPPKAEAVIDFSGAIADPTNRSYMLANLDSGDDIHPNAQGYATMVGVIPLALF